MILTSKWFSSYDVFLCYEIVYFYGLYVPSCNIFLYSFSCSIPFFVIFCTRVYFLSQTQEFNYLYVKSLVFEISNHFLILLIFSFIFNFYLFIIIFRIQITDIIKIITQKQGGLANNSLAIPLVSIFIIIVLKRC